MIYEMRFYKKKSDWEEEKDLYVIVWETDDKKPMHNGSVRGKLISCLGYRSKTFEVPSGVETIGKSVFTKGEWECFYSDIAKVIIPASVQKIEEGAFVDTFVQKIKIHPDSPCGIVKGDGLYTKDGSTLLWILDTDEECNFIVPDGVTRLGAGCFGYDDVASLTIPSSVVEIGIDKDFDYYEGMKIKAPKGSYAVEFAKKRGLDFEEF